MQQKNNYRKVLLYIAPILKMGMEIGQKRPDINPRNVDPVILTNAVNGLFGGFVSNSPIRLEPRPTVVASKINGAPIFT